ncbi:uncharacterized protein N7469_002797 [Penicillium citrinum]|uniref:Uncharacterized protein n=1 Tax=Penicillium citrinum TaxID=5077 RepID=A0A9W9TTV4_PENCI|nr:uncharacterized protein N7469_002797 [Penicillium citrinum]KAJ5241206.1 hypothetical protein N7469_002797 [Penicillium citrinum]KAK5789404.1 hypothetical protein VI817_008528 [Penicillium citrinum]
MTASSHMQQPASEIQGMFTADQGSGSPADSHVQAQRAVDPHTSLEDYNRSMLEHTHKQMSSFVDLDDPQQGSGISSRSSQSSGDSGNSGSSGTSNNGSIARRANGPPPTSASAQDQALKRTGQLSSPNEAKPSRY